MKRRQKRDDKKVRPKSELYIALTDIDFSFYEEEIEEVIDSWEDGEHISDIAEKLDREVDEIAVLIIDLGRKGKLERRRNGVYGSSG